MPRKGKPGTSMGNKGSTEAEYHHPHPSARAASGHNSSSAHGNSAHGNSAHGNSAHGNSASFYPSRDLTIRDARYDQDSNYVVEFPVDGEHRHHGGGDRRHHPPAEHHKHEKGEGEPTYKQGFGENPGGGFKRHGSERRGDDRIRGHHNRRSMKEHNKSAATPHNDPRGKGNPAVALSQQLAPTSGDGVYLRGNHADVRSREPRPNRKLIVIRHGERVDFTFGREWLRECFDSQGRYQRRDLNMPKAVPPRPGGPGDYMLDCPLTHVGHLQARLTGEAMREAGVSIGAMYTSPSLRCVETATSILEGMGAHVPIRMEPGLFEWLGWYATGLPRFMTPSQAQQHVSRNVDLQYPPVCPVAKLEENMKETCEQYYNRCHDVTRSILLREPKHDVVIVAHAASLDANVRQLMGKKPRGHAMFMEVTRQSPYAGTVCVEDTGDHWNYLSLLPSGSVTHQNNQQFNAKQFLMQ